MTTNNQGLEAMVAEHLPVLGETVNGKGERILTVLEADVLNFVTNIIAWHTSIQDWQPIETAPWDEEVMVKGPSGYNKPHDQFIINAYRVRDWHQGDWNDPTGTHLSERGWKPTHWKPKENAAVPEAKDSALKLAQEAIESYLVASSAEGRPGGGYIHRPGTREWQAAMLAAVTKLTEALTAIKAVTA